MSHGSAAHPYAYAPQSSRPSYQPPYYDSYGQTSHHPSGNNPPSTRPLPYDYPNHWSSGSRDSSSSHSHTGPRGPPYPPQEYSRHYVDPPPDNSRSMRPVSIPPPGTSWGRPAEFAQEQPQVHIETNKPGAGNDNKCQADRPFRCDMCKLMFNRQHDLKRHRDTHSGAKPFMCNGAGCGKSFTRKDALKRHQLVKRCGTDGEGPAS